MVSLPVKASYLQGSRWAGASMGKRRKQSRFVEEERDCSACKTDQGKGTLISGKLRERGQLVSLEPAA